MIKGINPKICILCCVLINSVLLNLWCVSICRHWERPEPVVRIPQQRQDQQGELRGSVKMEVTFLRKLKSIPKLFESRRNSLFFSFSPGVDVPHVYVRAWALGCFHSLISTRTFRRVLTACPYSGVTKLLVEFGGRCRTESDAWSVPGCLAAVATLGPCTCST